MKLCVLLVAFAALAAAQTQMNVDQLAEFIRSEIALQQHTDKQVAAYLKKVHLTEKLPQKTIDDLEQQGAGPKTVEALKGLQTEAANLKQPSHDATYAPGTAPEEPSAPATSLTVKPPPLPPPDSVRQKEILDEMRNYALSYTRNLPNFMCVEVMRRWVEPNAGRWSGSFHSMGTILAKVSYNGGQDNYDVYSVDGKYVQTSLEHVSGSRSSGEFGTMMKEIFEPDTEAEFNWDHWARLRGRKMAVFHYSIDSAHSKYTISYSADEHDEQHIVTAYEGLVYADEYTGEITRIKFHSVSIPATFPVHDAAETLDYDTVTISDQPYICPMAATVLMKADDAQTKLEIEFRDYRKFGTESTITYGAVAPAPLDASKTQEQPVNPDVKNLPKPSSNNDPFSLPTLPPPPPK